MKRYAILNEAGTILSIKTELVGSETYIDVTGLNMSGIKTELGIHKSLKIRKIKIFYQNKIDNLTKRYSAYELDSFADQRAEWRAWKQDDTVATPTIDTLANARGIDRLDLIAKIEKNVLYITTIQGTQNALEDTVNACETIEDVQAVEV